MNTIINDDRIIFDQQITDADGDQVSVLDVWISAVDGTPLGLGFQRPSWLTGGYTTSNALDGEGVRTLTIHFDLDATQIEDKAYTIQVKFTDSVNGDQQASFVLTKRPAAA